MENKEDLVGKDVSVFFPDIGNFFLNQSPYFQIIVDSSAVVRNNRGPICPCPPSPMVTSYKTMVQYHRQDIDIDTAKMQNISITTRITHVAL